MHGMRRTRIYRIWTGMKSRCFNQNEAHYPRYGGRGITVCDRWRDSFEAFYSDVGEPPSRVHSIERKDNNGNYEPGNVCWATPVEQANNRRSNHRYSYQGREFTVAEISRQVGIRQDVLATRLLRGWTMERATTEPVGFAGKGVYAR